MTYVLTALVGVVMAGEISLTLKPMQGLKFTGCLTNETGRTLYIVPYYLREDFHAKPDCDICPTGWVSHAPMTINKANDFIPLASGTGFQFEVFGCEPRLPWRITCVASTNEVHCDDKTMPHEGRIEIHSPEMPVAKKLQ